MMDADQIVQEIRSLPADTQRSLVTRILREFGDASCERVPKPREQEDPFLGLLADEPDLADEIRLIATTGRHEGREVFNGDEDRP